MNAAIEETLTEIAEAARHRVKARAGEWCTLIREIEAGGNPDPDRIDAVLASAGKKIEDIKPAVDKLARRKALAAKLASLKKLAAKRPDIEKRLAAARVELDAAIEKYNVIAAPLIEQIAGIEDAEINSTNIRADLLRDEPTPEIADALADVRGRMVEVGDRLKLLRRAAERRSDGEVLKTGHWVGGDALSAEKRQRSGSEILAAADAADKELPAVTKQFDDLLAEEGSIIERQLIP